MKKDIRKANEDVIKRQNEAVGNPNHPINDGLNIYFEERKRKLAEIKNHSPNNFLSRSSVKYSLRSASIFVFFASSSICLSKKEPARIFLLVSSLRSCSFCFAFSRASIACFEL